MNSGQQKQPPFGPGFSPQVSRKRRQMNSPIPGAPPSVQNNRISKLRPLSPQSVISRAEGATGGNV